MATAYEVRPDFKACAACALPSACKIARRCTRTFTNLGQRPKENDMSNEKQLTGAPLRQAGSQVVPAATTEEQAADTSSSLAEATRDMGMPTAEDAPRPRDVEHKPAKKR